MPVQDRSGAVAHGDDLTGGTVPGEGDDAPNLVVRAMPGAWTETDFINTLRTGVNPGGRQLDNELMPWKRLGQMTDDEMKALWLYLQSLPTQ